MSIKSTRYFAKYLLLLFLVSISYLSCWDDKSVSNDSNPTFSVTYSAIGDVPIDESNYSSLDTVTVLGNTDSLEKIGFTFIGWNTVSDGSGITYLPGATFTMGATNVILYAQWATIKTFNVTYNGNGSDSGIVPIDSLNYKKGDTITVLENSGLLAKAGSTFLGWSLDLDGDLVGNKFLMDTNDVILYAQWNSNPTFKVTYDGNGHTGGVIPSDINIYETGDNVIVLGNIGSLTKSGTTFIGWGTSVDGGLLGSSFTMGEDDITLYAQWSTNPTFTVTYDGNGSEGGIVPEDTKNYESGVSVTVLGNTGSLLKSGSTFIGWSTTIDGALVGSTFLMGTSNVTLYAQWSTNPTFTVTYDGNGSEGGIVPEDTKNYESGVSVTVLGNTGSLLKSGSTFIGWSTTIDGALVGSTFLMGTSNVTLYAQWSTNPTFTVKYDGNGSEGGTVPEDTKHYESGTTVTVLGNTGFLVKSGFTFIGWSTTIDGDLIGATFTMASENDTLYAQWSANPTYNVTYDGNGNTAGAVPEDINKYEENSVVSILGNTGNLEKTGYSFVGWTLFQDGSGDLYGKGEKDTLLMGKADVKFWAQWNINTYCVAFEVNGGLKVDSQTVTYNTFASDPVAPIKSGYTFAGWYTSQQFTIPFDFAGTAITADRILYAKWTVNQYSVTYNPNGSTSGDVPGSTKHDYNSVVTVSDNTESLARFGYVFTGWSTTSDGNTIVTSFTMDTINVTLYAKWNVVQKIRNMTLIFAKDSSFSMGSSTGNSDEQPVHTVSFTYDFYMDTTEVTQGDYDVVMGSYSGYSSPSWNGMGGYGINYPAYYVHWYDAVLYCNARSKAEGKDTVYIYNSISGSPGNGCTLDGFTMDLNKNGYRLPTEAEWEYACRAGTTSDYYWDNITIVTDDCAWYSNNSDSKSHEVAEKKSNNFGLYDMAGNVYEWCNDWYGVYNNGNQENPIGPVSGIDRVLRGGSYLWSGEADLRSATRCGSIPEYSTIGFRIVLPGE